MNIPSNLPTDAPPGVVISHSPAVTRQYIGSPSLAILPGGEYVASHDIFGPGSGQNTTHIFTSSDRGQTWKGRARLEGQFWSNLFTHHGDLYLMGTACEYGNVTLRKSSDGGRSWSQPRDGHSGLLRAGRYHCAPTPVVAHDGRLWRAMEYYDGPTWGAFGAFVMSAPEDADLLEAANWQSSNSIRPAPDWLDGRVGAILEGNIVITPEGGLINLLRVHHPDWQERAALMSLRPAEMTLAFDPLTGFISLPGGSKKFTIRRDAPSGRYWALLTPAPPDAPPLARLRPDQVRNRLVLASSANLQDWRIHQTIMEHPDVEKVGFQYADWLIDGEDLIAVVRVAYPEADGQPAPNAHDANWLIFYRIEGFRALAIEAMP